MLQACLYVKVCRWWKARLLVYHKLKRFESGGRGATEILSWRLSCGTEENSGLGRTDVPVGIGAARKPARYRSSNLHRVILLRGGRQCVLPEPKFGRRLKQQPDITYSMVQSRSWEANWFAASQEIPRILWYPKVHYRSHKLPPPIPILGWPNPVPIPATHLLQIHPNIMLYL